MKAARLHQRGGPEQIIVEEAPLPIPGRGEIRIRVQAAALTPTELTWDETYRHRDGSPRLPTIPGHDVAGIVESLGEGVGDPAIGESVYGLVDFPLNGSLAEYVVMPAEDVATAPKTLEPPQAAAAPLSALTAWQALFGHGRLAAGQRVFIQGGAGGVGAYALQLARWCGARVITTASARNAALVRELGADEVIDYTTTRFEQVVREVDLVVNAVTDDSLARSYDVIRRGGRLVSVTQKPDAQLAAKAGVLAAFFIVRPSRPQLQQIAALIDGGELRVNVERIYPLDEARQAFDRCVAGHLTGKIVVRVK